MDEYGILDYVPVIGDIYRYSKLGYKIGAWIGGSSDDYNNQILSNMVDCLNNVSKADDVIEALEYVKDAIDNSSDFDRDNCKKYQVTLYFYLGARIFHVIALCQCNLHEDDLKKLKEVSSTFSNALQCCANVWDIDKTIFTEKRSIIDQVRGMTGDEKEEIIESRQNWRKQYRHLYKVKHPFKWYLGMWIFA